MKFQKWEWKHNTSTCSVLSSYVVAQSTTAVVFVCADFVSRPSDSCFTALNLPHVSLPSASRLIVFWIRSYVQTPQFVHRFSVCGGSLKLHAPSQLSGSRPRSPHQPAQMTPRVDLAVAVDPSWYSDGSSFAPSASSESLASTHITQPHDRDGVNAISLSSNVDLSSEASHHWVE